MITVRKISLMQNINCVNNMSRDDNGIRKKNHLTGGVNKVLLLSLPMIILPKTEMA